MDAEDEKLGTLVEVRTGIYEMSELTYGGYLVKEVNAPEGFYLDNNAYYFEITEHGKTVNVENEAGKGFVNQAQKGALKIIKTSSDGKVEGFSFRVTGVGGYLNEVDRHYEQSELTEGSLYDRAVHRPETVEESVMRNLEYQQLHKAISELPETQRRRLCLYYFDGLTYEQIGELEGCTKRAVKFSVDIAVEKLKKFFINF